MALYQPRRPPPYHRDGNEQATLKPCTSGPRNGRLEVECGRSARSQAPDGSPAAGAGPQRHGIASGLAFHLSLDSGGRGRTIMPAHALENLSTDSLSFSRA